MKSLLQYINESYEDVLGTLDLINKADNYLVETALKHIKKQNKKNLTEDEFYELAKNGFDFACRKFEKEHTDVQDDEDDDVMWYDQFLDKQILDRIMEKMSELGFKMK